RALTIPNPRTRAATLSIPCQGPLAQCRGAFSAPNGAAEGSHGWSRARRQPGGAEPVVRVVNCRRCPVRGRGMADAPQTPPPPLPGRGLRSAILVPRVPQRAAAPAAPPVATFRCPRLGPGNGGLVFALLMRYNCPCNAPAEVGVDARRRATIVST